MKSLKINSELRTIEVVDLETNQEIYQAIGNGCHLFACPVIFENNDGLFIDDEGCYHNFQGGFTMADWYCPILGNAILRGCDDEGECIDVQTTVEELQKMIIWVSKEDCAIWQEKALNSPIEVYSLNTESNEN